MRDQTTMSRPAWLTPHLVYTFAGLIFATGSIIGVNEFRNQANGSRFDSLEKLINEKDTANNLRITKFEEAMTQRMAKFEGRLEQLGQDGRETIRLQEQLRAMDVRLSEIRIDLNESRARWDNLNSRLARKGL